MSGWGENLGAPGVCHGSEVIRAGFEPCRAAGSSRGAWHPGRCSALSFETALVILSPLGAIGCPFRARLYFWPNPGLKPWAMFLRPFGAEDLLDLRRPILLHHDRPSRLQPPNRRILADSFQPIEPVRNGIKPRLN